MSTSRFLISQLIGRGVSPETIVILVLMPLVATFVAAARYLVGIRGLGIFTPIILAATFWKIGLWPGLWLFFLIILMVTLTRLALRKIRLHYLVRMALLFWVICLTALFFLFSFNFSLLPLLLLILLTQDFVKIQIAKRLKLAFNFSWETLVLGLGGWVILSWRGLQSLALNYPELVILGTAAIDLLLGHFTGLRLLEHRRFRRLKK
jgi:hypothetical protein